MNKEILKKRIIVGIPLGVIMGVIGIIFLLISRSTFLSNPMHPMNIYSITCIGIVNEAIVLLLLIMPIGIVLLILFSLFSFITAKGDVKKIRKGKVM